MLFLAQPDVSDKVESSMPNLAEKTSRSEWAQFADAVKDAHVWQWSVALGLLIGALILGMVVSALLRRHSRRIRQAKIDSPLRPAWPLLSIVLEAVSAPLTMFLLVVALWVGTFTVLGLGDDNLPRAWKSILLTLMVMAVGWFVYRLVAVVDYVITRRLARSDKLMGNSYIVPLVRKTLKTLIVIGFFMFIAQNILRWDLSAMLTALGLGGLAFALAAQQTLSNLFGGVTIYADRPFQANDTVKFRAYTGIVQDVGFRSTRIRTVDGTMVTIPNAAVASEPVETLGHCPGLRQDFTITIKNNPTATQIKTSADLAAAATTTIQAILTERKSRLLPTPAPRATLSAVTAGTFTVTAQYWFATWDARELAIFHQEVLIETLRRLAAAGLELA